MEREIDKGEREGGERGIDIQSVMQIERDRERGRETERERDAQTDAQTVADKGRKRER